MTAADHVLAIRSGAVESFTCVRDLSLSDAPVYEELHQTEQAEESTLPEGDSEVQRAPVSASDGKLILAEEVVQGGGVWAASESLVAPVIDLNPFNALQCSCSTRLWAVALR